MISVTNVKITFKESTVELSADISADQSITPFKCWYHFPISFSEYATQTGDPFLALLVPIAMLKKNTLVIEAPVSERLLVNMRQTMKMLSRWFDCMEPIEIQAAEVNSSSHNSKAVGSFFTGGVDSFYTVIKNLDSYKNESRISHLLYVHGFDIDIDNTELFKKVNQHLTEVANNLGLNLLNISTNLRKFTDAHISWGKHEYGPALASVGLVLSKFFKTILIPSGHPYSEVYPTGTHPLIDPLWSNESTEFRQDGNEADRNQKIEWQISNHPVALQNLRVCWKNPDNTYNCGECAKCIRTKITLYLAGILDECTTFDNNIDFDHYAKLAANDLKEKRMLEETIDYLSKGNQDEVIREKLQKIADNIETPISLKKRIKAIDKHYLKGAGEQLYSMMKK